MKILVLTSTYSRKPNDTVPRFVDNLCHYLKEAGNDVHVIAPHAPGIPTQEVLEDIPVYRHRYWIERWQSLAYEGGILPSIKQNPLRLLQVPGFLLSQLLLARKLIQTGQFDVIHAHWIIPQGLVVALLNACSKNLPPVVITSHGGDLFSLKGRMLAKLKTWIINTADRLTLVSGAMKQRAVEQQLVEPERTDVIPMGVDSRSSFMPPPPGTPRKGLLFVGRLVDKKGILYLIQAMTRVTEVLPDTRLEIVGDGPLEAELRQLTHSLALNDKIHFLGAQVNSDIPGYLQRAAVTVFPSIVTEGGDQEGTPVAIMEALACEAAVIVSDYPGARDIVEDEVNGLIVPQRDADALADAIIKLIGNESVRRDYGSAGRAVVEARYDWRVISGQFQATFATVASATGNSSQ